MYLLIVYLIYVNMDIIHCSFLSHSGDLHWSEDFQNLKKKKTAL